MEVVSSNSDAEIARNDALQGLRWRLRELAANLMRIARGAGKPHGVGEQVYAVLEGYRAYHAAAGYYPGNDEIADAVSIAHPEGYLSGLNDLSVDEVRAEQQIVRGALQVAASRLMGQRTQETTGGHDMIEGMRALERAFEQQRAAWEAPRKVKRKPKGSAGKAQRS